MQSNTSLRAGYSKGDGFAVQSDLMLCAETVCEKKHGGKTNIEEEEAFEEAVFAVQVVPLKSSCCGSVDVFDLDDEEDDMYMKKIAKFVDLISAKQLNGGSVFWCPKEDVEIQALCTWLCAVQVKVAATVVSTLPIAVKANTPKAAIVKVGGRSKMRHSSLQKRKFIFLDATPKHTTNPTFLHGCFLPFQANARSAKKSAETCEPIPPNFRQGATATSVDLSALLPRPEIQS